MAVNEMKLPNFPLVWVAFVILVSCSSCAAGIKGAPDKYVFVNGYGAVISITDSGAFVAGKYYPAKKCSEDGVNCTKYGSLFAIIAPTYCGAAPDYKWGGDGVESFLMAVTPHDDKAVLLSTNYGGWVSFVYEGDAGVTELYYDPGTKIGVKSIWYSKEYVDIKKVVYKRVGGKKMMACSKERVDSP